MAGMMDISISNLEYFGRMIQRSPHCYIRITKDMRLKLPSGYDPCGEVYEAIYFNRADVQKALQEILRTCVFHCNIFFYTLQKAVTL